MTRPMREQYLTHISILKSLEATSVPLRPPESLQQQTTPPQPKIVKTQEFDPFSGKLVFTAERNTRNLTILYSFPNT